MARRERTLWPELLPSHAQAVSHYSGSLTREATERFLAGLSETRFVARPARGTVMFRWEVLNQNDEIVCTMTGRQYFLRRFPAG